MQLASKNFAFLAPHDPLLVRLPSMAEAYSHSDPNTALFKLRQFGEALLQRVAAEAGLSRGSETSQAALIRELSGQGMLPREVAELCHLLRISGNEAVHAFAGTTGEVVHQLKVARELGVWYHRTFADPDFSPGAFVRPVPAADPAAAIAAQLAMLREEVETERRRVEEAGLAAELAEEVCAEAERRAREAAEERDTALTLASEMELLLAAERARMQADLAAVRRQAAADTEGRVAANRSRGYAAARRVELDERGTRESIDRQLREAGWEADSERLRFSAGARPEAGKNRAIAEWWTDDGQADYVLFAGLVPIAVVEAKREALNVPGAIEQAKRYSRAYAPGPEERSPGGPWEAFRVPFLFATNGRGYFAQAETESGIWFLDARRTTNHPRPLQGWYSPQGLLELLEQDVGAAEQALHRMPTSDLDLRDYQRRAVEAVEGALEAGRRSMMVAMATGTGKTRTVVGLAYRLVKSKRFRRVLFLVDRTELGSQALAQLKTVPIEQGQRFADIYEVKELGDVRPEGDTRLHVATVQGMIQRVLFGSPAGALPVDAYDCIVVDECHRGYSLDREMSDVEMSFRSEDDYVSKYRRLIEHFDAVRIGLTATPALHTTQIFGEPVFRYTYREAVVDGYLVDHEAPTRIVTALAEDGITWKVGDTVQVYDAARAQIDVFQTPDEIRVDVEEFNRRVMTDSFNRVVCGELARQIDPHMPGKTLVFCVNDRHADKVVAQLKRAFAEVYGEVRDDAVVKITGSVERPGERIRRFRNERLPAVAVTVDLLTTGVDVPAIVNLVFLRRVRSRILYEQMMGRATRLAPGLYGPGEDKALFRIFDAVDLYAALQPYSEMTPVVVDPAIPFEQLARELVELDDDPRRALVRDQLVAKLRRVAARMDGEPADEVERVTGLRPKPLADHLARLPPAEAAAFFAERPDLGPVLDARGHRGRGAPLLISEHEDRVRRVEHGYGNGQRPGDYLDGFAEYVRTHINEVPALTVVLQRPRELTRKQLRDLALALGEVGYSEAALRTAWRDARSQDVAAGIVGYVRSLALGEPLEPYEDRVRRAVQRIRDRRTLDYKQLEWLRRIAKQMVRDTVVDRAAMDSAPVFVDSGGFRHIDRVFGGHLEEVLGDLHDEVWRQSA
ncbi:MAG TPA: type I restriction-modification system endonuclease [Longimicrobiaceae bacterium]|jgi:type I restriction enzyme R subunit|nr:type I restriction-modification system endonuclease [Longimicrobiaceae bacterium]